MGGWLSGVQDRALCSTVFLRTAKATDKGSSADQGQESHARILCPFLRCHRKI